MLAMVHTAAVAHGAERGGAWLLLMALAGAVVAGKWIKDGFETDVSLGGRVLALGLVIGVLVALVKIAQAMGGADA